MTSRNRIKYVIFTLLLGLLLVGIFSLTENSSFDIDLVEIGVIAPLTGPRADAGEYTTNATILAMEEINNDKERKYKIKLTFEDSQYHPKTALSAVNKLIDVDNVNYIIGPYGSSQVLSVGPVAERSKRILITPGSQSDEVTSLGDYIFRNIHNTSQEAPIFAEFVASRMESDILHLLVINVDFTDSYLKHFIPRLEEKGKTVGLVERFDVATQDFRTQLLKIKNNNPTDIFPIATPKHMGLILKQAHELGINSNFYHIGVEGPDLIEIAGPLAEGLFYPYSYDSQSAQISVKSFYDKYLMRFGVKPDSVAANSYDAVYLLSNCFEKVGDNIEKVKDCLYKTENFEGAGGTFGFDKNGDVDKNIIIKTVRNGEFVRLEE